VQSEMTTVAPIHESDRSNIRGTFDRPSAVFLVSLIARLVVAAVFLGSVDTINSLSFMPVAASHGYFYLPYFPIVENLLGSSALLMDHIHFLPIGLFPKLLPCIADSLLSVWLLRYDRFEATFRRRAAWVYAFCPLTIILVCIEGQWDSLWILPMIAALALSIQSRTVGTNRYRTCFIIGLLFGIALLSKPVALVVAGLLIPNVHSRSSLKAWAKELVAIATGTILTVVAFFSVFASQRIDLHQNFENVISYGGSPGFIVFGPARLSIFRFLNQVQSSAASDFRLLALFYVVAIVLYQVFSKSPMDTMAAAAMLLLVAPAVGGLAAQYLVWPLAFIIAAGRLRLAVAYSAATSLLLLLFFLIPASSVEPGENVGAFLPLHSLRFLGVPTSALHWAATTSFAPDIWLPILNLYVPVAMFALALYLLMSKWRARPSTERLSLNPLKIRATRVCVPFVSLLIVAVVTYSLEPTHVKRALVGVVQRGFTHYSLLRTIYSWAYWHRYLFWNVAFPYKDVEGGAWWGSIIVIGPVLVLLWSYLSLRGYRVPGASESHDLEQVNEPSAI
jgi:hypothetical protein